MKKGQAALDAILAYRRPRRKAKPPKRGKRKRRAAQGKSAKPHD